MRNRRVRMGLWLLLTGGRASHWLASRPSSGDLLTEWLSEEGYSVSSLDPGLSATWGGTPHLILAATDPRAESLATLDVLRIQPETAAIPVIVLSTSAAQQDQAQASGNVYATLSMPFEFPDLLDAVRGALAHTLVEARVHTLPSTREPGAVRAAGLLARAERELMLSWLQRIRLVEPFRARDDLSVREFLDNLPRVVNALVETLQREVGRHILVEDEDACGRVRAHADLRHRQGLPAEAVVREYQVLRETIAQHLRAHLPPEDYLQVADDLQQLLDDAVYVTVAEYTQLLHGRPERGVGFSASVES